MNIERCSQCGQWFDTEVEGVHFGMNLQPVCEECWTKDHEDTEQKAVASIPEDPKNPEYNMK